MKVDGAAKIDFHTPRKCIRIGDINNDKSYRMPNMGDCIEPKKISKLFRNS